MATKRKKASSKPRAPKKVTVDFSDAESVGRAMAKALDVPLEQLEIEDSSNYSGFGVDVYRVSFGGQKEYFVVENDDAAEELAIAIVTQDLEESPENFEPHFIESHIDEDRLRRDLTSDVEEMKREDLQEEARNPVRFIESNESDIENKLLEKVQDSEGNVREDLDEVPDEIIEQLVEDRTKSALEDPMQYLEDISDSREDAVKRAIEIAGIDVKAAAQEAVSVDGVGHFLSSYDGSVVDGPGGLVYWRGN